MTSLSPDGNNNCKPKFPALPATPSVKAEDDIKSPSNGTEISQVNGADNSPVNRAKSSPANGAKTSPVVNGAKTSPVTGAKSSPRAKGSPPQTRSGTSSKASSPGAKALVPMGFTELNFLDFSSDKFALIARAFCERNPRRASSIFHNYTCVECDHSFPCPSALAVHHNTHTAAAAEVNCSACKCWFDNPSQMRTHQFKHVIEKIMDYVANVTREKEVEIQEQVSKEEFLCTLGLTVAKREPPKPKIHNAFPKMDQKVNRDYFNRLSRVSLKKKIEYLSINSPPAVQVCCLIFTDFQNILSVLIQYAFAESDKNNLV